MTWKPSPWFDLKKGRKRDGATPLASAVQFLEDTLVDGPRQASEVLHEARSCGILFSSLVDAAKVVGVVEQ